jgi:hypothetical protein
MAKPSEFLYVVVGAGDLAAEKVRNVRIITDRKSSQKLYRDLVKRGRTTWTKVRKSSPTKQAVAQSKAARAQVKSAATSVTKALRANAKATKSAASKTGSSKAGSSKTAKAS